MTHLGGGRECFCSGERIPLDVEVNLLVLQLPQIPYQAGPYPLGTVLEIGLVIALPCFPLRLGEADVGLLLLAVRLHLRLVDGVGVQAPGAVHWTVLGSSLTVAVGVEEPLDREVILLWAAPDWQHKERQVSGYVQSLFRVCSECIQSVFRVISEYVQSMFRVISEYGHSKFNIEVISVPSASLCQFLAFFRLRMQPASIKDPLKQCRTLCSPLLGLWCQ